MCRVIKRGEHVIEKEGTKERRRGVEKKEGEERSREGRRRVNYVSGLREGDV